MKLRILMVNECSVLNTGYAIYGRELLSRLHATNKYEIAEHATYIHNSDPRIQNIPWTVYSNLPDDNEEQQNRYNSNPSNQFGEWRFEEICIDFKPHITFAIRDNWMDSFLYRSPLRPYYNLTLMPTVDAFPQNEEWLSIYKDADGVFTYQDWSKQVLDYEGGGHVNTLGAASPAADEAFKPLDHHAIKKQLGFEDVTIFGTVMRNQRRKLFPDLFASFRIFLDETKRDDVLLYCHTSYPDMGWDIPKLLLQYNLTSKVLFTYICKNCKHVFPHFFNDVITTCKKCSQLSAGLVNVQLGASNDVLAVIYNMFDLYLQISCSEGFGIPIIEAAACGVPVMAIDYSAMSDTVRKLGGTLLKPLTLAMELETGCFRAVSNNELLIEELKTFMALSKQDHEKKRLDIRQKYLEHYSWDTTAKKWEDHFDSIDTDIYEQRWKSKPTFYDMPTEYPTNLSNIDFARWLIINTLHETRFLNSYMEARLIHDLNYGVTTSGLSGMYFNDQSAFSSRPHWQPFDRKKAFKHFVELGNRRNYWENKRWEKTNT